MIGKHPPVARRNFHRPMPDVPDVNPVEPEPGCARRKRARRAAHRGRMDFFQARKDQPPVRAFAPVVEVAGDDERRAVGNFVGDQIQKPINLSPAVRLAQREMQTDRVQWLTIAIQPDHCVEQAPRLGLANRCIDIAPSGDRMPGEQRITVMPTRRNSIPAVGVLSPDAVRKYLVLMHVRAPDPQPHRFPEGRRGPPARRARHCEFEAGRHAGVRHASPDGHSASPRGSTSRRRQAQVPCA